MGIWTMMDSCKSSTACTVLWKNMLKEKLSIHLLFRGGLIHWVKCRCCQHTTRFLEEASSRFSPAQTSRRTVNMPERSDARDIALVRHLKKKASLGDSVLISFP